MKKQLSFFTFLLFLLAVATSTSAQVRFGIKGGLNLANINADDEILDGSSPKIIPGFHVGGLVEIGLRENIGVGVGLQLSSKGFKLSEKDEVDVLYKVTSRPVYLQIPVSVNYANNGFFAGAGPYIGFGIGGKNKETYDGESDSYDITFGDGSGEDDTYSSLDYGVALELGYTIGGNIRLTASYNLGLANALPKDYREDEFGKYKINHKVIGISAAYLFGVSE